MGGAPKSPSASTSQPARSRTEWRAEASPQRLAWVAPVTNAPPDSRGRSRISSSQRSAACSNAATPGVGPCSAAFWSHAVASQLDATVIGNAPPMTKPKNRPPAMAAVAGDPISSILRRTASGDCECSGRGSSSSRRRRIAAGSGATDRVGSASRYSAARLAASSRRRFIIELRLSCAARRRRAKR